MASMSTFRANRITSVITNIEWCGKHGLIPNHDKARTAILFHRIHCIYFKFIFHQEVTPPDVLMKNFTIHPKFRRHSFMSQIYILSSIMLHGIFNIYHLYPSETFALHWRHNDHDCVSNHQPYDCLLNRLFRRKSKRTSKLHVTGFCVGNSPGPVNSPHKGPVTRKMFPFDDVIMDMNFAAPIVKIHQSDAVFAKW